MSQQEYSERGKLNRRDAGSVVSNLLAAQPAIAVAATAVEQFAEKAYPEMPVGTAGVSAWIVQTLLFLACKLLAALLRNKGESMWRTMSENAVGYFAKPKQPPKKIKRRKVIRRRKRK